MTDQSVSKQLLTILNRADRKINAQKALDQAVAKRDKIQDDLQGVAVDDDDNPLWNAFEEAKANVERMYGEWLNVDRGYSAI